MKILDRYILTSFLKNWAISFMVLLGMYMILDMVIKFDEVVSFKPGQTAVSTTLLGVLFGTRRSAAWREG